jgi:hypothetical protein
VNNAGKNMVCLKGPSVNFPAGTQENKEILCFVNHASLYNRVNKANMAHNFFFCMFISFLYMFRANMCPSSGEIIISIRSLVFVNLCG